MKIDKKKWSQRYKNFQRFSGKFADANKGMTEGSDPFLEKTLGKPSKLELGLPKESTHIMSIPELDFHAVGHRIKMKKRKMAEFQGMLMKDEDKDDENGWDDDYQPFA